MKNRNTLSARLSLFLTMGCKNAGSFEPEKALIFVEEQMTRDEFDAARDFLTWVVANGRTFGHNLPEVWREYQKARSSFSSEAVEH